MLILSADIGSTTNAICIYDLISKKIVSYLDFYSKQKLIEDKLINIYSNYFNLFEKYPITTYIYEEPCIIGRGVNGTLIPQAVGVMKLVARQHGATIFSYSPKHVKKVVTGDGNADKNLVALAVSEYFNINNKFSSNHVSDAIAVLMCYLKDNQ